MKKLTLCYFILLLMSQLSSGQSVIKKQKLTSAEKKAVNDIALRFNKIISETGDISSIMDELFVDDFIVRFIKEKKQEISRNNFRVLSDKHSFAFYLFFKTDLLDKAGLQDWKRFYISIFNFKHYESISILNQASWFNKIELEDLENKMWFPPKLLKFYENHPNLKGFFHRNLDSKTINTVKELQNVNIALEEGFKLLNGKPPTEPLEIYKQQEKQEPYFGEKVIFTDVEFFGFPKGTKFISIWVSNGYNLHIIKVNGAYKILLNLI